MREEAGVESIALDRCTQCLCCFLAEGSAKMMSVRGVTQNDRYSSDGEAKECLWYFPLRKRLSALMKLKTFSKSINYEKRRCSRNNDYMTDVFDTLAWLEPRMAKNSCREVTI